MMEMLTTMAVNRDYLILTNRLNNLVSLINWMVGREEKKSLFCNVQYLCLKVVNVLLTHRCKGTFPLK